MCSCNLLLFSPHAVVMKPVYDRFRANTQLCGESFQGRLVRVRVRLERFPQCGFLLLGEEDAGFLLGRRGLLLRTVAQLVVRVRGATLQSRCNHKRNQWCCGKGQRRRAGLTHRPPKSWLRAPRF